MSLLFCKTAEVPFLYIENDKNEQYSIVELLAMIFEYAKEISKKAADGLVRDCVITVSII